MNAGRQQKMKKKSLFEFGKAKCRFNMYTTEKNMNMYDSMRAIALLSPSTSTTTKSKKHAPLTQLDLHPLGDSEELSGADHLLPLIHNYYQWWQELPVTPKKKTPDY